VNAARREIQIQISKVKNGVSKFGVALKTANVDTYRLAAGEKTSNNEARLSRIH